MSQNALTEQSRQLSPSINAGAVAIEQERAIAEAQGQLILAKRFPRDENAAHAKLMNSCRLPGLASVAFYNVPRAGGTVSGPSIRLAEEIARVYGNFEYGHKELSRDEGKSEVLVYAWDKENNNYSIRQITVMHVVDTKYGPKPCRDQKDIDDKIANVASKQMRGRILALLPKWMVEDAVQTCRATLAGNSQEPIESRVRKMVQAFAVFGVNTTMLEKHLGDKLANVTADQLVDLIGVYNAIGQGVKASDFFGGGEEEPKPQPDTIKQLNAQVSNDNKAAPEPKAAKATKTPKAEPKVEQQAAPEPDPVVTDTVVEAAAADEDDPFADV